MGKYIFTYLLLKIISYNGQILPSLHYIFSCLLFSGGGVFACPPGQASKYHWEDTWPDKATLARKETTLSSIKECQDHLPN